MARELRIAARNAQTPIQAKPEWIKVRVKSNPEHAQLRQLVADEGLHTVCQEAGCPNIFECWADREATFLIGGDACTRRCDFCQITSAKPPRYDTQEPSRVAASAAKMGLRFVTVTGVCRDDLADEGAWLYAETVRAIHALPERPDVELLAPDFSGKPELLAQVFAARPEVFAHNLETVPRLFKAIRPAFRYERSLDVISAAATAGLIAKSNLILGMGETDAEVREALQDIYDAGASLVTITQYLRPTVAQLPVARWVPPEQFDEFARAAQEIGFAGVLAGPLVRSSYRAGRLYRQALTNKE
ncbi:MAG: lipoyl synthase [Propionibacteriaceae bacterium]|jgi:lipoic acid synthetase|nr:lipoyl synthase [Propionibacteriaceae bacterium]